MKTISLFNGWRSQCFLILFGALLYGNPTLAENSGESRKSKVERDPSCVGMTKGEPTNPITTNGRSSAPRTMAAGPLHYEIPENKTVFERERVRFISESNDSRSATRACERSEANSSALDLFGSFWGDAKKNIKFQQQISGTISDSHGPLPAVTITVKDGTNVAISDTNGNFTITASTTDTLVFTLIGYKTLEYPLKGQTSLIITLVEDATSLQEVTVNAGYYKVKDKERTGNIAKITAKDIEKQPVSNVLAAMQGRMAGVSITQETGTAGGGFSIMIRGQNSLRSNGNAPLYIIDGVPYSSDPVGYTQTSTIFPTVTSPLANIVPSNIESIEVLKDADATAIYGSRGANGVVLITTKKGRVGKTLFTVNATTGTGQATRFMELMNTQQYLDMREQGFANDGLTEFSDSDYDVNGVWDRNRYTDWQQELTGGTAEISTFQGVLSGGSANTQYTASGNYYKETTIFPGDFAYKRGGGHMSLNHASDNKKFTLGLSAGYTFQDNDQPASDLTYEARSLAPNAPALYDEQGNLNWEDGTWENPLRNLGSKYLAKSNDLVANAIASYTIAPGLSVKSNFGFTNMQHNELRTAPSTMFNPAFGVTSTSSGMYLNNTARRSWILEPQVHWDRRLGQGKLSILAGTTFQQQVSARLHQFGSGFTSNSLITDLASASFRRVLASDETIYKYNAVFGRANYILKDSYILNLTARRDGSSRFGPGNRFANFAAIGMAWIASEEKFLSESKTISFLKLRDSYGTTGNDQIGDYQFLDTYSSGGSYGPVIGLQPTRLFNPDFGWESNTKLEAAVEIGLFSDRIFLTAATYQNRSSNQLVGIPLPATTGFTSMQANLDATVQNTGVEFTLRTVNFTGKDFQWSTTFNLAVARNKLLEFPGLESSVYSQLYRIGEPLNIRMVYEYTGLDPETGIYQFTDVNGDGEITFPEDRQKVADLNPEYYGGLQNQLSYKGFKLDFLLQFVKQKNRAYATGFPGMMGNQPVRVTDNWEQPGDIAPYQIYTTGYNEDAVIAGMNYMESDAAIDDASFIRLKNISLSYDVPLKGMQCTLSLQGQNMLTFTKYRDGDPEASAQGFIPPLKVVTAGFQLTF